MINLTWKHSSSLKLLEDMKKLKKEKNQLVLNLLAEV